MSIKSLLAGLALTTLAATTAQAELINATVSMNAQTIYGTRTALVLDNATGAREFKFRLAAPSAVEISFSAECAVKTDPDSYLNIAVELNGTLVMPTQNADYRLCSGNHTFEIDGFAVYGFDSIGFARAGLNTVKVYARGVSTQPWAVLDDISLIVSK